MWRWFSLWRRGTLIRKFARAEAAFSLLAPHCQVRFGAFHYSTALRELRTDLDSGSLPDICEYGPQAPTD